MCVMPQRATAAAFIYVSPWQQFVSCILIHKRFECHRIRSYSSYSQKNQLYQAFIILKGPIWSSWHDSRLYRKHLLWGSISPAPVARLEPQISSFQAGPSHQFYIPPMKQINCRVMSARTGGPPSYCLLFVNYCWHWLWVWVCIVIGVLTEARQKVLTVRNRKVTEWKNSSLSPV